MKRPSFQFYPADWLGNTNLRRCTHAERGIWIAVMCLMHDSDEYGVLRWPLRDIASAVNCKPSDLVALAGKGVLKGDDMRIAEAYVYVPRSGRRDGPPVVLIEAQDGPLWFCSRMVRDEHVRGVRGEGTRFGDADGATSKAPRMGSPKRAPMPPFGDGPTSSSTSTREPPLPPKGGDPEGFAEFWNSWPASARKQDRKKCAAKWRRSGFAGSLAAIVADVDARKRSKQWQDGFEPAPLTYLNGERWNDGPQPSGSDSTAFRDCV